MTSFFPLSNLGYHNHPQADIMFSLCAMGLQDQIYRNPLQSQTNSYIPSKVKQTPTLWSMIHSNTICNESLPIM